MKSYFNFLDKQFSLDNRGIYEKAHKNDFSSTYE